MASANWRGTVGVVKPTYESGSLVEFIRLLPEGVGVIPVYAGIKQHTEQGYLEAMEIYHERVAELARIGGFDLIIMPTHAGRFRRMLLGSTTAKVLNDADCPVMTTQHAEAVIPPRSNRLEERSYDKGEYKNRNVVERFINVIKHCRRVATRYEKTARNFLSVVALAATFVLLN